MEKNGLFLCSIGSLIILYSMNPKNMQFDVYSFTTGVFLAIAGGYFIFKGKKKPSNGGNKS